MTKWGAYTPCDPELTICIYMYNYDRFLSFRLLIRYQRFLLGSLHMLTLGLLQPMSHLQTHLIGADEMQSLVYTTRDKQVAAL